MSLRTFLAPATLLAAEPEFTPGTTNTISWSLADQDGTQAEAYQVQRATDDQFTVDLIEIPWLTKQVHQFRELQHGAIKPGLVSFQAT